MPQALGIRAGPTFRHNLQQYFNRPGPSGRPQSGRATLDNFIQWLMKWIIIMGVIMAIGFLLFSGLAIWICYNVLQGLVWSLVPSEPTAVASTAPAVHQWLEANQLDQLSPRFAALHDLLAPGRRLARARKVLHHPRARRGRGRHDHVAPEAA